MAVSKPQCGSHLPTLPMRLISRPSFNHFGNRFLCMSAVRNSRSLRRCGNAGIPVDNVHELIRRPQGPLLWKDAKRRGRIPVSPSKWALVSHDKRHAKSSGNYHRVPGGTGRLVVLGQSSPAASVKAAPALTRLLLRRAARICLCP